MPALGSEDGPRRAAWLKTAISSWIFVAGVVCLRHGRAGRILSESYARGEITEEEYRHRIAVVAELSR